MKKMACFTLLCLLTGSFILLLVAGCSKNPATRTYTIYSPQFSSKSDVMASINGSSSRPVDSAGKIYVKDKFIFLNELNKGIHIFDNTDPAHPVQTAFLSIPGNQDIAVKGNTLYADMYQDLLAIDISNPRHVSITGKIPNVFSMRGYLNGYTTNTDNQVITGWTKKDTTVPVEPGSGRPNPRGVNPGGICGNCPIFFDAAAASSQSSATGTAGSMAGMVLINDYLYAIAESHSMDIINVANASSPSLSSNMFAGFDLETIYPFGNQLFLGSSQGVYIFDLTNPAKPTAAGQFSHGRACDPVITDGNYAYITLHAGTACGGASNELDVINVQNPAPLLRAYPMTKPMGLCKDGNLLFVCDGSSGVKVYNAKDPANLQLLTVTGGGQAYDVLASNQHLLVVGDDGLYQYDYSMPSNLRLLSFLPAK